METLSLEISRPFCAAMSKLRCLGLLGRGIIWGEELFSCFVQVHASVCLLILGFTTGGYKAGLRAEPVQIYDSRVVKTRGKSSGRQLIDRSACMLC